MIHNYKEFNIIIVIPTYGRDTLLERTLNTLSSCVFPENYLKTIVIENGPKEGAEEVCRKFENIRCEYRYTSIANKSSALNLVIETLGDNTFIIFFDDDIRISPKTISAYAEFINKYREKYFYGGPLGIDYEKKPSDYYSQYLPLSARGWKKDNEGVLGPHELFGCNWAVSCNQLKAIGKFNKKYGPNSPTGAVGQEREMMLRLDKNNIKAYYVPDALVWHYVPKIRSSFTWTLKRWYKIGVMQGINATEGIRHQYLAEEAYLKGEIRKKIKGLISGLVKAKPTRFIDCLFHLNRLRGVKAGIKVSNIKLK